MKVLLINGSPKVNGCTYTALSEVAKELEKENIETEIFHVGTKLIRGCMALCTYIIHINSFTSLYKYVNISA